MTQAVEDFLRNTTQIRNSLSQIFPLDVTNHIVTLIVQDNLHRKSEKYYKSLEEQSKGDENTDEVRN
jgi:hypothetical protein